MVRKYEKSFNSVSITESENINENCQNGLIPSEQDLANSKKVVVPVVTSMTKYLFSKYRLQIFHYPIFEHKSVDSILFLIDDTILTDDKNSIAEPKLVAVPHGRRRKSQ